MEKATKTYYVPALKAEIQATSRKRAMCAISDRGIGKKLVIMGKSPIVKYDSKPWAHRRVIVCPTGTVETR